MITWWEEAELLVEKPKTWRSSPLGVRGRSGRSTRDSSCCSSTAHICCTCAAGKRMKNTVSRCGGPWQGSAVQKASTRAGEEQSITWPTGGVHCRNPLWICRRYDGLKDASKLKRYISPSSLNSQSGSQNQDEEPPNGLQAIRHSNEAFYSVRVRNRFISSQTRTFLTDVSPWLRVWFSSDITAEIPEEESSQEVPEEPGGSWGAGSGWRPAVLHPNIRTVLT